MDPPAAPDVEKGIALSLCNIFLPAASARPGAKLLLTILAHYAMERTRLVVALDGLARQETLDILYRNSDGGSSPLDIVQLEIRFPLMAKKTTGSTL